MTNPALVLDQTFGDAKDWDLSPSPKMKFNPSKKTLAERVVGLKFTSGVGRSSPLIRTETNAKVSEDVNEIIHEATAVYEQIRLPTIADYEDFEELNDIEATENALYYASRKLSW